MQFLIELPQLPEQSSEGVLPVTFGNVTFLQVGELEEMCWPMILVIELPGCAEFNSIFHAHCVLHPHKIVVPWSIIGDL